MRISTWSQPIRVALVAVCLIVALVIANTVFFGDNSRTVTAHFDRAVAVYPGTDVRVMGVRIGEVTAVVPDGNSVRVEMVYDDDYKLPADARAAVVTPTLIADRYVQIFPAYIDGAELEDGAEIALEHTQIPIELDRMFSALDDLAVTLGPPDGETRGALDALLTAGATALDGQGELGAEMIRNLSAAAETFAANRGPLFENVRALAEITETLAANDATVDAFVRSLADVSEQFADERDELQRMLASLARVLGTVEGFVQENRELLSRDVELLASLIDRVDRQKESLGILVQEGALAMGNLAVAFDPVTGTFGSRLNATPGIEFRPDQFLCQTLTNAVDVPPLVCETITALLEPLLPALSGETPEIPAPTATAASEQPATTPDIASSGVSGGLTLSRLLGGDE